MKNIALLTFATLLLTLGITAIAVAGHHYHGCSGLMKGDVSSMDLNNDGMVEMDEFTEPHMEKYRRWFKMLDSNDDGDLSQDELDEFRKIHNFDKLLEG
jgi:hypothetical protein